MPNSSFIQREDERFSNQICCILFEGGSFHAKKGVCLSPLVSLIGWGRSDQYKIYGHLRYWLVPLKSVLNCTKMLCCKV